MSGLKTSTPDAALVAYLADARARVDAVLESWGVRAGEWGPAAVPAAMRYSLLSTGKRLRPTLVFAAAEAVAGEAAAERVADLAAAVEVVHAYSLVHDDLPCMDNDDLRRGRPTTHRAFDVPTAVVAGYHMVALGARVLDAGLAALAPEARRGIALELFRPAGAGGMIGGPALAGAGRSGAAGDAGGGPPRAGGVSFFYARGPGALHCDEAKLKCASERGTRNSERGTGEPDSAMAVPRSAFRLPRYTRCDGATRVHSRSGRRQAPLQ